MTRTTAITLAFALLLCGGAVHGLNSDRWRTSHALEKAAELVPLVPRSIAGWEAEEIEPNHEEFAMAGARAYWTRRYRKDGMEVLAILMVGRGGRMAIHTPEVCYQGAGFDMAGQSALLTLRSAAAAQLGTFWTARFHKPSTPGSDLQLYWAWNDGGGWQASANPRWQYAGTPALYKLYFSRSSAAGPEQTRAMDDFLRHFVPALDATLGHAQPANLEVEDS